MWKLTDKGKRVEPTPDVPWRDLTDQEFAIASAVVDENFPDQKGSLKTSGLFEYVADKAPKET